MPSIPKVGSGVTSQPPRTVRPGDPFPFADTIVSAAAASNLPQADVAFDSDAPSTITATGQAVSAWGVATILAGSVLVVPDTVTGGQIIRFDTGGTLAIPAGVANFTSQVGWTGIIAWRSRNLNPGVDHAIFDSSGGGATRGFQWYMRDNIGNVNEIRRTQLRISDGSSFVVDQLGDADQSSNYFSPEKWNITVIQLSPTRAMMAVDRMVAFDNVISQAFPAGAPGNFVIGGCQIDIKAIRFYKNGIDDASAALVRDALATRYGIDMVSLIAGSPTGPRYQGFPSLALLNDGVTMFQTNVNGQDGGLADAYIQARKSTDQGASWSAPQTISQVGGHGVFDAMTTVLANGHLLLLSNQLPGAGAQVQSIYLQTSTDQGASWTAPASVSLNNTYDETSAAPIVEHGGAWYMPMYSIPSAGSHQWSAYLYKSTDLGATWPLGSRVLLADGVADNKEWSEPALIIGSVNAGTLAVGTWLVLLRDDTNHQMYEMTSLDGITWSAKTYVLPAFSSGRSLFQIQTGPQAGRIFWVGRSNLAGLPTALFERTATGVWKNVPNAHCPFLVNDGANGNAYSGIAELAPGLMYVMAGIEWSTNIASIVGRKVYTWEPDGLMPMTVVPATATVTALTGTIQLVASGAGNYTYPYGANNSGGTCSASGFYTPGAHNGVDTINVTDLNGQVFPVLITVTGGSSGPSLTSVVPDVGPAGGGTAIDIFASAGLNGTTGGALGGVALTSYHVVSDTHATAVTGAHATTAATDLVISGSTLSACFTYLDAAYNVILVGEMIQHTGGSATSWTDLSGNGNNATTSTNKPGYVASVAALNNKPASTFTVADYTFRFQLPVNLVSVDNMEVLIAAVATSSDTSGTHPYTGNPLISEANNDWGMNVDSAGNAWGFGYSGGYKFDAAGVAYTTGTGHLFELRHGGGNVDFAVGATSAATTACGSFPSQAAVVSFIGSSQSPNQYFIGDIAAVLISNVTPPGASRTIAINYLRNKYGIT